jgi:hypothetical protein
VPSSKALPRILKTVPVSHRLELRLGIADKKTVRQQSIHRNELQAATIPWALQFRAISTEEPSRLVKTVTGAILGCGGWMLSRSATDAGLIDLLFEFERRSCLEIYSILIASGVELSRTAHVQLTELCQCTILRREGSPEEIVSVDLEIQTCPLLEQANTPAMSQ